MQITQEQFNQLATKKDLKEFATKKELFTTKKELNEKTDKLYKITDKLNEKTDKIITKMLEMDAKIESIEERMATKDDFNNLAAAIDTVLVKLDTMEHAFVSNQAAHDRFEQRITRTEKHLNLKSFV
jgi:hypothetical protein